MNRIKVLRAETAVNKVLNTMGDTGMEGPSMDGVDLNHLEDYATDMNDIDPTESTMTPELTQGVYEHRVIDKEKLDIVSEDSIKNHKIEADGIIKNNYLDGVRGNVFRTEEHEPFYTVPASLFTQLDTPPNHEPAIKTLMSDAAANLIENPFKGMDLKDGCSISMWVKMMDPSTVYAKRGLLLFLGEFRKNSHPTHPKGPQVWYQPRFSVSCDGTTFFTDAYQNVIWKEPLDEDPYRRPERAGHNWEHFIFVFKDNDFKIYVNGKLLAYDESKTLAGKRFGSGERPSVTDFISDEKTNLFFAVTTENEGQYSDVILFDDVIFYDTAADENDVKELYEEALTINLP